MRDDTTDPRDTPGRRDPNHIWLRQSITFSVNGQTRTLEMALPLRPGATPDEVESLLDEADAGMRRLSRRLDAHLAEVNGATPIIAPAIAPTSAASVPAAPQPATQPVPERPPERRAAPAAAAVPHAAAPAAQASPAASQPRNLAPAAPAPTSATSASGGPDLTRPQFMAEIAALGLDPRMAMERLQTRTLNGLNLREALEALRRQMLREGGAPTAADSADSPAAERAPADLPAPIGVRFDEEDEDDAAEFELSYPDADDLPGEDEYVAEEDFAALETAAPAPKSAASAKPAASRAPAAPLGDVPDLDDLLGPAPTAAPAAPAAPAAIPAASAQPAESAADALAARARELIASLRAAHGGGQPTEHQRSAYKNVVIDQLGETKAAGVARALWRLTPERLGPEQLDALIHWGKEDAFEEEVEAVLDVCRAEYRTQQAQQQGQRPTTGGGANGAAAPVSPPAAPAAPAARRAAPRPTDQADGADEMRQSAPSEASDTSAEGKATTRAAPRAPRASRDSRSDRSDAPGAGGD